MLPRLVGLVLLVASAVVAAKLIYGATIFQFWTMPWSIGMLSVFGCVAAGTALLLLDRKGFEEIAFLLVGLLYTVASVLVYSAWAREHIGIVLPPGRYFGFLFLWSLAATAGFSCFALQDEKGIFHVPAWLYAIASVGALFGAIAKYLFMSKPWHFGSFVGELFLVSIGAIVFLICHEVGK